MDSKTLTRRITSEIWNELIAKPYNEKGSYQLKALVPRIPAKLKLIIEKHLEK